MLERKLGYHVSDDNFEAAVTEASRSPLDRLYEEHMASKGREPRVIVRHGFGQVIGVR